MLKPLSMQNFKIDNVPFQRLKKALGSGFSRPMMKEFGTVAVNFSKERFVRKDWHHQVHEKWPARKRKARGSLMVKSGRLKRSIQKLSSGDDFVIIGSDVPYAKIHNEGGRTTKTVYVKAHTRKISRKAISEKTGRKLKKRVSSGTAKVSSHTRKMNLTVPQRQFMGKSRALEIRMQRHLKKRVDEILSKKFK